MRVLVEHARAEICSALEQVLWFSGAKNHAKQYV